MNGDPFSVLLMSPCKEQSATLNSSCLQLCPQSCTTRASSKKIQTCLPVEKQLAIYVLRFINYVAIGCPYLSSVSRITVVKTSLAKLFY